MKLLSAILITLTVVAVYFYNTIWFHSFFLYDSFYENIVDVSFDVTKKGESILIPIKYTYKTCYDLAIAVPGRELSDSRRTGKGQLGYVFISEGKVVADGITQPVSRHGWGGTDEVSIRNLMVFDLPFPGASKDLLLELTVLEPFSFMQEYKGQTSIVINPGYTPKFDKCYNEDLRIKQ